MSSRVVLITGCSSGIGRALAGEALRRDFVVYATARDVSTLANFEGENVHPLPLDVTSSASIRAALEAVRTRHDRIDVLINNAGQSLFGPLSEVPLDKVSRLLEVNLTGQLAVCQAVIPMMAAARSGCIVNVGSMVGVVTTPFVGAYAASKAALHLMSETLRMEVAPLGIDVVVVQPGAVRSRVADNAVAGSDLERYAEEASLYRSIHAQIERRAYASQDDPMPSQVFAVRVWDKLTRPTPPPVIRVGGGVGALRLIARLPQGLRSRIFSRHFGLHRLDVN